jgi:two-component system, NarL family, nitrate/nitrite response regulator NarL
MAHASLTSRALLDVARRDTSGWEAPARVVIVEDHVMMAEGLRTAVNQAEDLDVVGLASSFHAALALVTELRPDVVVLDHPLPDAEAPDAVARLRAAVPGIRVLVISALADHRSVVQALESGADGYLLKDEPVEVLARGIRTVLRGDRALSPALLTNLLTRLVRADGPSDRLSQRQEDVLQCLADGMTTDEIVRALALSHNTVRNHIQRILTRLGAHSKLEAVTIALREGLVRPPGQHDPRPRAQAS